MRILFFGDVIGRNARDELIARLPELRVKLKTDAIIVNGENAANGFGVTAQICADFYKAGVDCVTTGNHAWDQREIIAYINSDPRLLRPINYPEGAPGKGFVVIETAKGHKILIINAMGRLFMDAIDDPFAAVDKVCKAHRLGKDVNAIVIDMHAEACSEKMGLAQFVDGRASLVVGSHTHIPTADAQVLPNGTGYQTDAGMCGSYDSVIGMDKSIVIHRWTRKMPGEKLRPAEGPVTLCGTLAEINPATGLCTRIEPVRIGGRLSPAMPEVA